ncbi:hypothetical protein PR202_ga09278 [Eleusine coracana subsp. coracana]|uniref:DUF6598 domain-containing protein n=1 Tax=Eleusine coracana subsp. coracana TaxID=191504 RepID=A0AAV5C2R2_ELECO|nr:hypothetical protein PR202_ga09278 [Eleusine coracana subsp. coracana]
MEMSRSVPEVQVKNGLPADPEQMMMRKDKEKRSVIPIALEKLLKEKREKGPSRAVVLIDSVSFEVQLTAKGTTKPSEDKVLAVDAFSSYHAIAYMSHPVMS